MRTTRPASSPWGRLFAASAILLSLLVLASCSGTTGVDSFTVSIRPAAGLIVGVGGTTRFFATKVDASGTELFDGTATWTTADAQVATIAPDGLATGVATGTTTVTATIDGVGVTATLEVFVPDAVTAYLPGVSYFGRNDYVEYIPGELPVVLSAPHGGTLMPSEIPNRSYGVTGGDLNTAELTLAVRDALVDLTGYAPHVVISRLHRSKLDPNRDIVEAAQGSAFAERAWDEFQGFIERARGPLIGVGGGMYFDMHGHGHAVNRLELGYLLSADRLNQADAALNSLSVVQLTSIRELGKNSPLPFSQLLRGPTSFGGFLEAEGVSVVPSPGDPSPGAADYFSGGYNTRRHGSFADSEIVSGIQIEHHRPGLRDTDANRRAYAVQLAYAIRLFMLEHYGFFEP